ncbi:MAG: DNA polymerase III subunit gamma/tau, partial [Pseudomonadota bacterium]
MGPAIDMAEPGVHCAAIAQSRHPDVLEMDAASRTGIGDIRELIEAVRYGPVQARYKVYIIDEVHMLSIQAFNGLLKTLEEPPPHVKFIFATTEIRKVPVTVLSRCQRFDLRRIEAATLSAHLSAIVEKEGAQVEDGALALIARAAEGSVRDALSLLDQALVQTGGEGGVSAEDVRSMLGLADRTRTLELLDAIFKGEAGAALDEFRDQYETGADPATVVRDLLELVHWLTRIKVSGEAAVGRGAAGEGEALKAKEMADKLAVNGLTRAWNMLLKGAEEIERSPQPVQAADMLIIRLAYAADLPTPDELVKRLSAAPAEARSQGTPQPKPSGGG